VSNVVASHPKRGRVRRRVASDVGASHRETWKSLTQGYLGHRIGIWGTESGSRYLGHSIGVTVSGAQNRRDGTWLLYLFNCAWRMVHGSRYLKLDTWSTVLGHGTWVTISGSELRVKMSSASSPSSITDTRRS
jgi:hypothetical protein